MRANRILAAGLAIVVGAGAVRADDSWLKDENGVLELMLAHEEKKGPDGGILRVDRNKRSVTWIGVESEVGCKQKVKGGFDDVESVADNGREAGFVLEMKKGKMKKLVLLPLPYAEWFVTQWQVAEGRFGQALPEGTLRVGGPGGPEAMSSSGTAASGGPTLKHKDIPDLVEKETKKAITAVRDALGSAGK